MLNRFAPNKKFLKWHMDEKLNHRFLMIDRFTFTFFS